MTARYGSVPGGTAQGLGSYEGKHPKLRLANLAPSPKGKLARSFECGLCASARDYDERTRPETRSAMGGRCSTELGLGSSGNERVLWVRTVVQLARWKSGVMSAIENLTSTRGSQEVLSRNDCLVRASRLAPRIRSWRWYNLDKRYSLSRGVTK